jgi:hypothetical protein
MNDNDLITVVRESFTRVHTTTGVEQIVSRGRVVRARRRIPQLGGALAVAAGAGLAASMLVPGSHPGGAKPGAGPGVQPGVQLAAWTVTRQAGGTIRVTIKELLDPAGLQSRLRAYGIPASVTLIGQENPSCRLYPASVALRKKVLSITPEVVPSPQQGPPANPPQPNLVLVFRINPSALPGGVGIQLAAAYTPISPGVAHGDIRADLVYASAQCTG